MSRTRESVACGACPDVRAAAPGDDVGDRCVVIIGKPVWRIPVIVDLFLGALQRAAGDRSEGLLVYFQVTLGQQRLIKDLIGPFDIGAGRECGRQDHHCD